MMNKRRLISLLCFLLLFCFALTGCTKDSNTNCITLKLAAWAESPELMLLVADYNATHTDSQIEVTTFYDFNIANYEAAISRARTELSTNREYDLYSLDSLNVSALVNAGVLANLYEYMDRDTKFVKDDYYMNLWSLFETNNKLYEFVPVFNIAGTYGPKHIIGERTGWTIEEFQDVAALHDGVQNFVATNRYIMLNNMIQYGIFPYVDSANNTCHFEDAGFPQWLELIDSFSQETNFEAPISTGWLTDFNQYYDQCVTSNDTIIIAGMPAEDSGGPVVMALSSHGISSTTEHPELCWEFLMSLMEDETQERLTGFTMRRDRMEEHLRKAIIPNDNPDALFYGWTIGEEESLYPCMTEESVTYFRNLLETIDRCAFRNEDVYNIIVEEATAYFNEAANPLPIETVAAQLQDRVMKCLQEPLD